MLGRGAAALGVGLPRLFCLGFRRFPPIIPVFSRVSLQLTDRLSSTVDRRGDALLRWSPNHPRWLQEGFEARPEGY